MKKLWCLFAVFIFMFSVIFPILVGFICFDDAKKLEPGSGETQSNPLISYMDVADGKVREALLEDYLVGVLAAEMPAEYHIEALKAQSVAARSYILSRIDSRPKEHPDAIVCTNPEHCKSWVSEDLAKKKLECRKSRWILEKVRKSGK